MQIGMRRGFRSTQLQRCGSGYFRAEISHSARTSFTSWKPHPTFPDIHSGGSDH
jgi:hypothetical protein